MKKYTFIFFALILTVCLVSKCNGQSDTLHFDYNPKQIKTYKVIGFLVQPVKVVKGDTLTFDSDEIKSLINSFWSKNVFENFVVNWKVNCNDCIIVECEINIKGWHEEYTFNQFRKLFYE